MTEYYHNTLSGLSAILKKFYIFFGRGVTDGSSVSDEVCGDRGDSAPASDELDGEKGEIGEAGERGDAVEVGDNGDGLVSNKRCCDATISLNVSVAICFEVKPASNFNSILLIDFKRSSNTFANV